MTEAVADTLLAELKDAGIEPTGVTADSRRVVSGDLFLAYPGLTVDGRRFIPAAVEAGACAVVAERGAGASADAGVPIIDADGAQRLGGYLADRIYGRPSATLWVAGVTGTNGKTTTSQWLAMALASCGVRCGIIGTLGSGFPGRLEAGMHTTPDAPAVHRELASLRDAGAEAVAMEVSSIGLHQGRVNGVRFDVAIFTNLSRDHLDYHGDMETYAEAKADLFRMAVGHAVINLDDAFGVELARRMVDAGTATIGYTLVATNAAAAPGVQHLVAEEVRSTASGIRFTVCWAGEQLPVSVRLVAPFNVSNLLAVMATLLARGVSLKDAVQACMPLTPPEGRMQIVGGVGEPLVLVDYAHTPDALEKVLEAARDTTRARRGKLICVVGCGGDRDKGKRPIMGEVASRLSDTAWLTSDNPRTEDPSAILEQVAAGAGQNAVLEIDRAQAIRFAIHSANPDDVIVLAGKGHETYQEINGVRHPFSDVDEARAALVSRPEGGAA
ncbi:UDP-N-acetylmuramoyl-L-alanyl-D-glutamate--2,6-diaminopimelate ligase [Nitrogeniibacter aestuarii]|uniref:UDP-N-acetylmuramoyl-L-alanyl-D-glutamate--2, 6-diaminopimelate ligase n=1 Tax=Nitrogeniibacter aestuarii TaxID=2815343 RepID=UPI001E3A4274|nr:UDP-N-acetylmuramoyl-L-alanyl-D-glutamate--2,6-diaminopimelate ligase [Nitrogeniibacter aestuarii]